jgi:ferritin-like metal-binding protein YciE
MALFTKPIKNLDDLFIHTLQDIYYAENQITQTLPRMIDKAHNPQLRQGFESHLQETRHQIQRLEEVFQALGQPAKGTTCEAIDGIVKEAKEIISDVDDEAVLDVALASSAQAVEHYEISRYGTLIALAHQLGHDQIIPHLQATLEEEKAADRKLTEIAESRINRQAA